MRKSEIPSLAGEDGYAMSNLSESAPAETPVGEFSKSVAQRGVLVADGSRCKRGVRTVVRCSRSSIKSRNHALKPPVLFGFHPLFSGAY